MSCVRSVMRLVAGLPKRPISCVRLGFDTPMASVKDHSKRHANRHCDAACGAVVLSSAAALPADALCKFPRPPAVLAWWPGASGDTTFLAALLSLRLCLWHARQRRSEVRAKSTDSTL